jgi:hypothetical protein
MIRKLKGLGLLLIALSAMGAVGPAAADAAQYTCSHYGCTATGSNTKGSEVFGTEGGKVECDSHFVTHAIGGPTSTLELSPTYTNCEAFGFLEATVNTEGCFYQFHVSGSAPTFNNSVDVVCTTGKSIKIAAGTCRVEVKPQSGLTNVATSNSGSSVLVKPNVSKIAYTVTQDGFLCPFPKGTGNTSDGTYTGEVTISRVGGGSIAVS